MRGWKVSGNGISSLFHHSKKLKNTSLFVGSATAIVNHYSGCKLHLSVETFSLEITSQKAAAESHLQTPTKSDIYSSL